MKIEIEADLRELRLVEKKVAEEIDGAPVTA